MPEGATERQDEGVQGTETAWSLLTSPRVFLGLTIILGVLLAWTQTVPQRLAAGELAPLAPFAEAEALRSLGLDDVWVGWPVLLIALLLALVAAGLLLLRGQRLVHAPAGPFATAFSGTSPASVDALRGQLKHALGKPRIVVRVAAGEVVARRGYEPEAATVVVLGIAALITGLFIGRANSFDARFTVLPDNSDRSQLAVRDGDIYLPSARPLDLRCAPPDPMDPRRHLACTLQTDPSAPLEEVTLSPGTRTSTPSGLTLRPLSEALRFGSGAFDLLLRRDGAPERLRLIQGTTTKLGATGDELTAYAGPDGPLVLWKSARGQAVLLAPPIAATATAPSPVLGGVSLEHIPPTAWTISAESHPESILLLLGVAFMALGLLVLALVPSATVTLTATRGGTRVRIRSTNRPTLAENARNVLLAEASQ